MISAAFIFEPGSYDARFSALDAKIEAAAVATPGYLGRETWQSEDGRLFNATYYWADLAALKAFSGNADHLEAKRDYKLWYKGFHIVISEVLRAYGDGSLEHITAARSQSHPSQATHP